MWLTLVFASLQAWVSSTLIIHANGTCAEENDVCVCIYHSPTFQLMFLRSIFYLSVWFHTFKEFPTTSIPRRLLACSNELPYAIQQPATGMNNDWHYFYASRPRTGSDNKKLELFLSSRKKWLKQQRARVSDWGPTRDGGQQRQQNKHNSETRVHASDGNSSEKQMSLLLHQQAMNRKRWREGEHANERHMH